MSIIKSRKKPTAIAKESETTLVNSTLAMLALMTKDGLFWRNNSGVILTQAGSMVRLSPAGTADIVGILGPHGLFVALEAKVPSRRKNVSDKQKEWISKINNLGGYAGVFCSIDEAMGHIEAARLLAGNATIKTKT